MPVPQAVKNDNHSIALPDRGEQCAMEKLCRIIPQTKKLFRCLKVQSGKGAYVAGEGKKEGTAEACLEIFIVFNWVLPAKAIKKIGGELTACKGHTVHNLVSFFKFQFSTGLVGRFTAD